MARTDHGLDLTSALILLPGSKFKRTRSGFDTGTRIYRCDRSVTESLCPAIGASDAALPGGLYARMFVDDVDIDEGKNQIDTLTVSFLGLYGGAKAPVISGESNSSQTVLNGATVNQVTPSVSVTYISDTLIPTEGRVGLPAVPPIADAGSAVLFPFSAYVGTYYPPLFTGWIIGRSGFRQSGPLWEYTDTYEYMIINDPRSIHTP